ncbi:MAG: insulinase family protein, partial [Alphaproteobacteria bacterium]|nr:insulinase family protein [Alphaproteobacteria bacterium]
YGPIPSGSVPPRQRTHSPFLGAEAHFTLRHPHVHQPMVLISFRAPGVRENPEDSLALEILQDILGGGPTSRLYRALVNDQKIASVAELVYRPYTWDDAELSVYASPLPGVKPERVEASLRAEIRNVIESGVTETELKDSIARLQSAAIYARDSLAGPAMTFGQALATGASAEHVEYWPRNIAKITVSRVQGAAAKYLGGQSPVGRPPITAYLLPEEDKP